MEAEESIFGPEFFVALAFVLFVGLLLWKKVHLLIISALDKRAADIKSQLEEARALRDEAHSLLAQSQREQRDAAAQVKEIAVQAEREAKVQRETAERDMEETMARRLAMAEEKIAQAEAAAVKEVREVAVGIAAAAARQLLAAHLSAKEQSALVDDAIGGLDKKLH